MSETPIAKKRREALEKYQEEKRAKKERKDNKRTKPVGRRPKAKVSQPKQPRGVDAYSKGAGGIRGDGEAFETGLPKEVLGINTKKFMRLVRKRTSDDLHRSVDAVQAMSALTMFHVIEQCETGAKISDMDADDRVKMLNAIKGANASANDTLKSLKITATTREEVDLTDEALERLSKEDIDSNLPPSLESEYMQAQKDVAQISGKVDEATQAEQQELVNEIKEPIESGSTNNKDDKVIHVEEVGIGGLG